MRLIQVKVGHFRNVINSGSVDIEHDVTCLVGKNESGKTAFLHALYRLNPARQNVQFSVPGQYPAWLEKRDRLRGIDLEKIEPITTVFELSQDELSEIEEDFGEGAFVGKQLTLSRKFDGTLCFNIPIDELAILKHLRGKIVLPKGLAAEARGLENISAFLSFLDRTPNRSNVSAEDKARIAVFKNEMDQLLDGKSITHAIWGTLKKYWPSFFYFAEYSTLPYSVPIKEVLEKAEDTLSDDELTARALLRLAAADDEYLLNPDYERRKRELENVANALTEDVLRYWSQNPTLRVNPDITQTTVQTPNGKQTVIDELKIRIWDDRHLLSLPFSEHSTGFQWFFSFLAAFSEYEFRDDPLIILLDEPALGLHARAQSDFLRFIDERLAPKCQVLYTTHSPFMVAPRELRRVRIVEDRGREHGMQVSAGVMTTDADTLFPLQGALGYDMAQHLFIAPHNLVVEGTSDFTYLMILSDYLKALDRLCLDEKWSIVPVGGADMIPTFVALLGNHLDVTVLVDAQKAGHQRLSHLASQGYLSKQRIVTVGQVVGRKLADLEDLFDPVDYLRLYNEAFSADLMMDNLLGDDPIVSRIARHIGCPRFDHGIPANLLLRQRDRMLPSMNENTLSNFEKLFSCLNATMNQQSDKGSQPGACSRRKRPRG